MDEWFVVAFKLGKVFIEDASSMLIKEELGAQIRETRPFSFIKASIVILCAIIKILQDIENIDISKFLFKGAHKVGPGVFNGLKTALTENDGKFTEFCIDYFFLCSIYHSRLISSKKTLKILYYN